MTVVILVSLLKYDFNACNKSFILLVEAKSMKRQLFDIVFVFKIEAID